ncbi:sensor histidine kinase [Paenibacillus sacheonensis]|uniref:GHKL domain-containing protein n=1 Tax=Paenibacillus sacheonensis TaxID=742054 RepID=A0A7X4YSM1_9BACL|nr:GHKL domain-containing protein [Paenibacillus sacheonensis]MBM7569215.1 signal transduction histidine kinase [Paenibacillus sacheonensis]NBC71773.1 GHKL domain-containing protein [Paenibacillus sacheonensis]
MRRNVWLLIIVLIAVLLGVNNTVYYFTTKKSLEDGLRHELDSVAKQVALSIESSRNGAEIYQDEIGRELRAASIAAQYALDSDVEKVTNDQLSELAKKLDMVDITLLKRTADNIVLYKSSDPKEPGYETDNWDPWYKAFNQLFDDKNVSIDWGQRLPNFWTGPFEFSSTSTDKIQKWGYYHDGSTNYIIDPYISYKSRQLAYDNVTGVSHLIGETLEANQWLKEIAVLNPETFPGGRPQTISENGELVSHMTQDSIIEGSYTLKHHTDTANVKLANESGTKIYQDAVIGGRHVIKLFIPVEVSTKVASMLDGSGKPIPRYVLSLVADYGAIQQTLDKQLVNIGLIIGIATLLSLIFLYWVVMAYRKSQDKLVRRTQETYLDEINSMFQSIRSQRHDFVNHVQTMQSLAELGKTEELKTYAAELTGEIRTMNEIISIGNPAIAALIRSKSLQAEMLKVDFASVFTDMNKLELGIKSLDMTRLLGNLIDNAFDEVMTYGEDLRQVSIEASQKDGYFQFMISNTCLRAEELRNKPLFQAGYSSKVGNHSGLGLHIVKSIVDKYKGVISLVLDEPNTVTFIIKIPY